MKTTIEIADSLLKEAQHLAARRKTTLRSLVETGLREVLAKEQTASTPFRLRAASFKGKGLQQATRAASWNQLREMAYEDA